MKFRQAFVVAIAGAVLPLIGCTDGGMNEAEPLLPVQIPTLTPEPQPFPNRVGQEIAALMGK